MIEQWPVIDRSAGPYRHVDERLVQSRRNVRRLAHTRDPLVVIARDHSADAETETSPERKELSAALDMFLPRLRVAASAAVMRGAPRDANRDDVTWTA